MRSPTRFERLVWSEVQRIEWGETKTYGEVAEAVGSAAQPTGNALRGLRQFPDAEAVVPWHRVTESDGLLRVNRRTREQARLLLLEGHVVELRRKTDQVK